MDLSVLVTLHNPIDGREEKCEFVAYKQPSQFPCLSIRKSSRKEKIRRKKVKITQIRKKRR